MFYYIAPSIRFCAYILISKYSSRSKSTPSVRAVSNKRKLSFYVCVFIPCSVTGLALRGFDAQADNHWSSLYRFFLCLLKPFQLKVLCKILFECFEFFNLFMTFLKTLTFSVGFCSKAAFRCCVLGPDWCLMSAGSTPSTTCLFVFTLLPCCGTLQELYDDPLCFWMSFLKTQNNFVLGKFSFFRFHYVRSTHCLYLHGDARKLWLAAFSIYFFICRRFFYFQRRFGFSRSFSECNVLPMFSSLTS